MSQSKQDKEKGLQKKMIKVEASGHQEDLGDSTCDFLYYPCPVCKFDFYVSDFEPVQIVLCECDLIVWCECDQIV